MVHRAQGCPGCVRRMWDRDGTLEMDRENKGLCHCREYETEGRHHSQNSLLDFRKTSSALQSELAGQNCSLSSSQCAVTRAEGLLAV